MAGGKNTVEVPDGRHEGDVGDAAWASGRIDRLVTGELGDAERLELLGWLDAEPARWRRCGLAFLEAQTLREALAAAADHLVGGHLAAIAEAPAASRAVRSTSVQQRPWRGLLVAAAALTVTFVLGWALGHRPSPHGEDAGTLADNGSPGESATAPGGASAAGTSPIATAAGNPVDGPAPTPVPGTTVALVRARIGEGANAREVVLPVLTTPAGNAVWAQSHGPMPDYVRRQWERQGYRVTERRKTVPVTLADGRQVDLPVDQVMLTFVGQPVL